METSVLPREAVPLGYHVRRALRYAHVTADEVRRDLGLSIRSMRSVMAGDDRLPDGAAAIIARRLGVSAAYWANLESTFWRDRSSGVPVRRPARRPRRAA